ncbi:hypothetical protein V5O48_010286 [Marasmius crinis-equi]|uniref:Uncharacterized protein n=1 Tax=Marasmius crinis-equi TaxID=585013 RepID=A0ABR3F8T6_9AGAR
MDPALSRGFKSLYRHYRLEKSPNNFGSSSGTTSEDPRSGGHVELELSQTSDGNQDITFSKPDLDESRTGTVTLPSQPASPAKAPVTMHRHPHCEAPRGRRSYVLANENVGRMYSISNAEYSNLEKRL